VVAKFPRVWHYELTYAALLFRAGQSEKSLDRLAALSKSHPQAANGYSWLFLALAHHSSGHAKEARRCLDQAVAWMEAVAQGKMKTGLVRIPFEWTDAVALETLRAEAEELILGKRKPEGKKDEKK